ncbi:MAG: hypothetical protein AAB489_05210 [Patescibacteria group bacterium]
MNSTYKAILALLAALLPLKAHAFQIPNNFCGIGGAFGLSTNCGGGGSQGLSAYLVAYGVNTIGVIFLAVALAMFFQYAVTLIVGSNDESIVTEAKTAYAHAITGAAIVSMASYFAYAFSPDPTVGPGGAFVYRAPIEQGFLNAILYFKVILGAAMLINIVIQATRMITAQSQEDADKAKQRILYGFVGVGIILLANSLVTAVYPPFGGNSGIISDEIVGIANFLLAAFGLIAVIAIIIAGVYLLISVKEDYKEKAKQVVQTSIIALAVVVSAYAIVHAFVLI